MARLTDKEKRDLLALAKQSEREPPLPAQDRFVEPTITARKRYMHFATQIAQLHPGHKPVRFKGNNWKL